MKTQYTMKRLEGKEKSSQFHKNDDFRLFYKKMIVRC